MKNIIQQSKFLVKNYDIVATNPPYMGNSGMNPNLKDYLKKNYPNSKSDLFAVFIEKCHDFCNEKGFVAMITQQSFMFLSTFEKLRVELINNHTIINMAHLGAHAFEEIGGEVVQATTFVNKNNLIENYKSTFHRLTEFNSESKKEEEFHNDENKHNIKQADFDKIPGNPIAYWISNNIIACFKYKNLLQYAYPKAGISTGDNNKFVRYWFEVNFNNINFTCDSMEKSEKLSEKWFPYNKGGSYRKWFGNNELVINWENNGYEIRNFKRSTIRNPNFHFKKGLTWSTLSNGNVSFRYNEKGFLFDSKGANCIIKNEKYLNYIFALLNSNVTMKFLSFLSPTIDFSIGSISKIPIIIDENILNEIDFIVLENINIQERNWNLIETSWNFDTHSILKYNKNIKESISDLKNDLILQRKKLKKNEESINRYFIAIYKLEKELTNEIGDNELSFFEFDDVTLIKSFISYAVGCMFGRYSLDNEGLQFAGGEFNINNYSNFIPDDDNIIPVLDSEYFEDDIVNRFVEFVKTCFGEETLEENLDFIANALAKNKKPSREKIRDYLLKNFFNDHKKTYKKCPIYWQFSSGKENGFNCLVYMHRYEPSLVARIRTDYLHKTQKAIEQAIANCDNIINHSSSSSEITKATKDKNKLQKQLKETQEYDEALAHIANQNIEIDLDDGVKVNYAKFQNIEVSREGKKAKKINLLKKL